MKPAGGRRKGPEGREATRMLDVLANRTYRHLFLAQAIALLGTGLATVALALLAFDLAGADAGAVLGTALAIKMLAYIGVAPVAAAFAERLPRRAMLVALDLVRAAVALSLPFVTEVWQVYLLIFILQSASAGFTPTFQATIPDVLAREADYTKALSLSRLAYDLESLVSPALAAALLTMITFHSLFFGTVLGFIASALLVLSTVLPTAKPPPRRPIYDRITRGTRIFLATPRLRGLLALNLAAAAASAMIIVNTVVIVQGQLKLSQNATAMALAAFGAGSMLIALALPKLFDRLPDRNVMLFGAAILVVGLALGALLSSTLPGLLATWFWLGLGYSMVQTPAGRLVRRSAHAEDRPALFAAQFALSHGCWLVTYPLAGWLGAKSGLDTSFYVLTGVAAGAALAAARLWPRADPAEIAHAHEGSDPGDPHVGQGPGKPHSHAFVIDDQHRRWPE